ncbi:MAG: hypothetical protein ACKPEO_14020 [Sphaerospermopsis kisseleviana]|uniref:Uncharacterized protein n=1 Tax=Sphaerospermopsis reniformis TaxID=531300 RepID=A0A479ZTL0_9CYAN|nr:MULTISPECIES: hypothetical protein [Sphaerospermopsis]MBD2132867.1 hypothetical protein [Sphaerospermopsis sp. FACHB-1094]MBD2145022.1 hypothetical protein [Sphaerospermopsis sp. FACHB-1194]GCL35837.1 hypothetical protein SR1949_09360 [Sphaerospermopsis reniformis]
MSKKNFITSQKSLLFILGASLTTFFSLSIRPSQAGNIPRPSDAPLELNLLTTPQGSVITANTINSKSLTIPSLWWAKEISENKLLDNWIAYPASENESARVDLIVNQQIWSLLDYLERYRFVHSLGNYTRNLGYNIRVFNYQKEMLATYTCKLDLNPDLCNIQMTNQSKLGLPIEN